MAPRTRKGFRSSALHIVVLFSALVVLVPSVVAAQQSGDLKPAQDIVQVLWDFEKRVIQAGQKGAGQLFTGLASIHLTMAGIKSLFRGSELYGGVMQFVEELFVLTLCGASIAVGPTWALSIINFFRGIGREVASGAITPQVLIDTFIKLNAVSPDVSLMAGAGGIASNFGATLIGFVCLGLAGLIALVVFLVESESHLVIGAGMVMLGFGGAAATRSLMTSFWQYAVSAGLRLMLVEMIYAATVEVLLQGAARAEADPGSIDALGVLAIGLLIVLGFMVASPIVVHALTAGRVRAGAEAMFAGLPRAAVSGGVMGAVGSMASTLLGGGGDRQGMKPGEKADGTPANTPSPKMPNEGGASPQSPAASGASGASAEGAKSGATQADRGTPSGAEMPKGAPPARGEGGGAVPEQASGTGEDGAQTRDGSPTKATGAADSAPLPAAWQGKQDKGSAASAQAEQRPSPSAAGSAQASSESSPKTKAHEGKKASDSSPEAPATRGEASAVANATSPARETASAQTHEPAPSRASDAAPFVAGEQPSSAKSDSSAGQGAAVGGAEPPSHAGVGGGGGASQSASSAGGDSPAAPASGAAPSAGGVSPHAGDMASSRASSSERTAPSAGGQTADNALGAPAAESASPTSVSSTSVSPNSSSSMSSTSSQSGASRGGDGGAQPSSSAASAAASTVAHEQGSSASFTSRQGSGDALHASSSSLRASGSSAGAQPNAPILNMEAKLSVEPLLRGRTHGDKS